MAIDLKKIRKIASKVQKTLFKEANAISSGLFKTQFKGTGLQFREHQVYEPGDDIRFIDWKLSAKMRKTYIRTFEEERNVEVDVVIDLTPSMMIGYKDVSKTQAAMEIAAMIGMIAQKTGDKVKVILLTNSIFQTPKLVGADLITALISIMQKANLFTENGLIDRDLDIKGSSDESRLKTIKAILASKKHLLYLSDFSEVNALEFKKLMGRKNFHAVRLITPIDYAKNIPYSLITKIKNDSTYCFRSSFSGEGEMQNLNLKTIDLDISKNYLNNFVHLMRTKI